MQQRFTCQICQNEIVRPGEECPYCKSRSVIAEGASPRILVIVFAVMIGCFALTTLLAGAFEQERRDRGKEHFESANSLMTEGNFDEAIEHYRDALLYSRTETSYQLGLANALFAAKEFPETEHRLVQLRGFDPTSGIVNYRLAQLAHRGGRIDESVAYYRTAVYGHWDDATEATGDGIRVRVRLELIDLLEESGRDRELAVALQELTEIDPNNREFRHRYAAKLLDIQAPEKASENYSMLLNSDPRDRVALLGRAEAEFRLGNYLTARTHYNRAQALGTDPATSERIALCNRVIELDPTRRGISVAERYRRSRVLVDRTRSFVMDCQNPLGDGFVGPLPPLPSDLRSALDAAEGVLRQTRDSPSDEKVETNILLAEELWDRSTSLCEGSGGTDEPLGLVLAKLAR